MMETPEIEVERDAVPALIAHHFRMIIALTMARKDENESADWPFDQMAPVAANLNSDDRVIFEGLMAAIQRHFDELEEEYP